MLAVVNGVGSIKVVASPALIQFVQTVGSFTL